MFVLTYVVSYARPHLWADLDESLQGHGWVGCGTIPTGPPRGGGKNFVKAVVATMELFSFLCHCKNTNNTYILWNIVAVHRCGFN